MHGRSPRIVFGRSQIRLWLCELVQVDAKSTDSADPTESDKAVRSDAGSSSSSIAQETGCILVAKRTWDNSVSNRLPAFLPWHTFQRALYNYLSAPQHPSAHAKSPSTAVLENPQMQRCRC